MAIGRFAAAIRPLHARAVIGRRMALRCIIFVFIACAALNVPRTLWNDLRSVTCPSDDIIKYDHVTEHSYSTPKMAASSATYYFRWHGYLHKYNRPLLERAYFWFYSVVAILLPLGLLVVVSAWLIIHLRGRGRYGGPSSMNNMYRNNGGMRRLTSDNLGHRRNAETIAVETVQLNDLSSLEPTPGSAGWSGQDTSLKSSTDAGRRTTNDADVDRRPRALSSSSTSSSSSSYMSTLVAVAAAHVFLVCPAELLTFARHSLPLSDWRGSHIDFSPVSLLVTGKALILTSVRSPHFSAE